MPRQSAEKPLLPRPTDAELAVLRVLWKLGSGSVRDVREALNLARTGSPLAYTTVLRFLQIMTEKGLVVREDADAARGHIYAPKVPAERTKRQMVSDLLERAFGGSVQELVLQALGTRKISTAELREIRQLLNGDVHAAESLVSAARNVAANQWAELAEVPAQSIMRILPQQLVEADSEPSRSGAFDEKRVTRVLRGDALRREQRE